MSRAKGSGTLVKRGKFFMAKWIVDGKIHTRSTKCTEKRAALLKLDEFVHPYQVNTDIETLQNLQSQINVLENEKNRTPLENAIRIKFAVEAYKKDINFSGIVQITEERYNSQMNVFEKFIGEDKRYMYEINKEDAERFMQFIKAKNSISTYNTYVKLMKRIFKVCMKIDSNIKSNPFAEIKQLKDTKSTYRRAFTDKEIQTLIDCAGKKRNTEWKLFFMLGAYTGLRKEDCITLKKSEVNLNTRKITRMPIKTIKTGITAIIPIADVLYNPLKEAMNTESDYVLPKISQYSNCHITEEITEIFKDANIPQSVKDEHGKKHHLTGFHSFRHTLTKKLYAQKVPVTTIMKILGHKTLDMSLHYGFADDVDISNSIMSEGTKNISISRDNYDKLMRLNTGRETIDEILNRVLKYYKNEQQEEMRKQAEEINKKIEQQNKDEINKLIDEVFNNNK